MRLKNKFKNIIIYYIKKLLLKYVISSKPTNDIKRLIRFLKDEHVYEEIIQDINLINGDTNITKIIKVNKIFGRTIDDFFVNQNIMIFKSPFRDVLFNRNLIDFKWRLICSQSTYIKCDKLENDTISKKAIYLRETSKDNFKLGDVINETVTNEQIYIKLYEK